MRRSFRPSRAFAAALAAVVLPLALGAAAPPSLRPLGTPQDGPYAVLAGSLHDHSYDSDGHARGEDVAAWEYAHRYELGIDFGSLTEHSDFFPLGGNSLVVDQTTNQTTDIVWRHQAAIDATYAHPGAFTFLRGFEYTSDQENHLNVIGSQNWASPVLGHFGDLQMTPFYTWLTTPPVVDPSGAGLGYGGADGVGQFNHPDSKGALNFDDYAFDAAASKSMSTIEIFGDQSYPGGLPRSDGGWYWFALSRGWTVGPVMDWDNHYWTDKFAVKQPGAACGSGPTLPCERSLVFATQNTTVAIMDALRARRTAATQVPGLWAALRTPSGVWMGSTTVADRSGIVRLTVDAGSQAMYLRRIDIVSDNGVSPYPYYYGDNVHGCTDMTPVPYGGDLNPSCAPEELGHTSLAESYIVQHQRYVASGGHATRKDIIDAPPANTTVATQSFRTHATSYTFAVRVPPGPSLRPDGKHFFYAVAYAANGARAWTAPILVAPLATTTATLRGR